MGKTRGPSGESRAVRVLTALADNPDGLTTAEVAAILGGDITSLKTELNHYGARLGELGAAGLAEAVKRPAGPGQGGPARNIWRLTVAGRRKIAEREAVAEKSRQAERMLRTARALFGPDTPPPVRQEAAFVLRAGGFSSREISTVFGVSTWTISEDLRGTRPGPPIQDVITRLAPIAQRAGQDAELARQAVRAVSQQLGPGAPREIRREAAGILRDLGIELIPIGAAFGVSRETIRRDLDGRPAGLPPQDPLGAIAGLARRAEHTRHSDSSRRRPPPRLRPRPAHRNGVTPR